MRGARGGARRARSGRARGGIDSAAAPRTHTRMQVALKVFSRAPATEQSRPRVKLELFSAADEM